MGRNTRRRNDGDPVSTVGAGDAEDLYDPQGNAAAALQVLQEESKSHDNKDSLARNAYNQYILKQIVGGAEGSSEDEQTLRTSLQKANSKVRNPGKQRRNECIMVYNHGLTLFSQQDYKGSLQAIQPTLVEIVNETNKDAQSIFQEALQVYCNLMFLHIENALALALGHTGGLHAAILYEEGAETVLTVHEIMNGLQSLAPLMEDVPPLKFQYALLKSRVELAGRPDSADQEAPLRAARKECKLAMEVFQQKMRPSATTGATISTANQSDTQSLEGEGQSVMSGDELTSGGAAIGQVSLPSSGSGGGGNSSNNTSALTRPLQRQLQAALNLKANTEQLKGNIKKSLILCSEAQGTVDEPEAYYEAIHYHNLALVYESNDKRFLALHSLSKALQHHRSSLQGGLAADGTVQPRLDLVIVWDTGVCALRARQFTLAYECLALAIAHSTSLASQPEAWLKLGEASLGIYAQWKEEMNDDSGANPRPPFQTIKGIDGKPSGILLPSEDTKEMEDGDATELFDLGTPEDLNYMKKNPLRRARAVFAHAHELCEAKYSRTNPEGNKHDTMLIRSSIRVSLAFCCLEEGDYAPALEHAKFVVQQSPPKDHLSRIQTSLLHRQQTTARLYATEACCALHRPSEGISFLLTSPDGRQQQQHDALLDQWAFELSGVTLELASAQAAAKRKLAAARALVRASASVATAQLGNLGVAKSLARSAQSMEDAALRASPVHTKSTPMHAKEALIYCLLREGNTKAALTLLRSAR